MWIALALLAACGSATTSLVLKRAVGNGGAVVSTVVFRTIAGLLLGIAATVLGTWPVLTETFWRTLAVVIPFEIGGMLCLTLALRTGDLSAVQPIMGLMPLLVMAGGVAFLQRGAELDGRRRDRARGGRTVLRWASQGRLVDGARPRAHHVARELVRSDGGALLDRHLTHAQGRDSPGGRDRVGGDAHPGLGDRARLRAARRRLEDGQHRSAHARSAMGATRRAGGTQLRNAADGLLQRDAAYAGELRRRRDGDEHPDCDGHGRSAPPRGGGVHRITGALLVSSGVGLIALFG